MNKKTRGLWLMLLAALTPTVASADLKADLLTREKEMWIAWGKKDPTAYLKYLDADYRFVADDAAPVVGKEANIKALKAHSCELDALSLEDVTMHPFGPHVGVIGYTAIAELRCERQETLKFAITAVWHQHDGAWTTSHYHQSLIKN